MKAKWCIVLSVAAICLVSCRRHDVRTVLIEIPEMKNDACVERVSNTICRVRGVRGDSLVIDLRTRTALVSYESIALSLKNIEFAIANAGFAANKVPANEKAAKSLPAECR